MNSLPLHPMIVHFPIVLAILLPIFAIATFWAISRGLTARAWLAPFGLAILLTISAFVALRTGEAEEDRVENVVGDRAMHAHEEAAEQFMTFASIVAGIALLGLLRGRAGTAARGATAVAALLLVLAAWRVGDAGGRLVYQHGAASAYTDGAVVGQADHGDEAGEEDDD